MTLMVYFIGHMTNDFWDFIRLQAEKRGEDLFVLTMKGIWYLCPHLDMMNLKKVVVHFEELGASATYFPYQIAVFHAVVYSGRCPWPVLFGVFQTGVLARQQVVAREPFPGGSCRSGTLSRENVQRSPGKGFPGYGGRIDA